MRNCIFLKWIIDLLFYSPPVINKRTRMHKLCVICIVQGVRSEADFLSHFIYKHKDFHDITYMSWKSHLTLFFFTFMGILTSRCFCIFIYWPVTAYMMLNGTLQEQRQLIRIQAWFTITSHTCLSCKMKVLSHCFFF